MLCAEYCNREVVITTSDDSVRHAAKLMRLHHVGDVVVVEGPVNKPVGLLTDRDMVVEILAEDINPDKITVGDIMSDRITTIGEDKSVLDALKLMRLRGIRRIPVVDNRGGLCGILTLDDIIDIISEQILDVDHIINKEQAIERKRRKSAAIAA